MRHVPFVTTRDKSLRFSRVASLDCQAAPPITPRSAGHRPYQERRVGICTRGIRINAVCPGTIETPMVTGMIAKGELSVPDTVANQPIGRLGRADEIAAAVLWLCSPGASLIVGVALPVDGGYTAR